MDIQPKLIALCIKQDRKAEYELYKITYSYLMSICMRYSRDKDIASESLNMGFLKILKNLTSYKPEVPFKSWIRRVMVNTLIDEYRKNKKERERITYVENYYDNSDFSDVNEALSRINYKQILVQINLLPEATKKVFNLFAIDGYSHKEIGEMLGISEGTSKWHLNAARQKLKEYIENSVLTRI
ncbi:RNA polymerase sigma factor [Aurantibacillus circumpalustris]|uniref:RNA polymerase sigma factor n=1 Tax=Aurantibacillus circumpalustris TaxID=3036359 RepID=UPI00295B7D2B|nr:RNA polymerase sigma factor [Aurantibacillus circumpalustris]